MAQFQFSGMSELGNSFPPPEGVGLAVLCLGMEERKVGCRGLTCGDKNGAAAHYASHLLAAITPPSRCRRDVIAQMPLSLILNVERKDVV